MHASLFSNPRLVSSTIRQCKAALQIEDETVDYGSAFGVRDWDPFSIVDSFQSNSNPSLTVEDSEKTESAPSSVLSQSLSSFSTHVVFALCYCH